MLKLQNVSLKFSNFSLHNISVDIEAGCYFVIVGPTGAGKTLLLETIAGLQPRHTGDILVNGENITKFQPETRDVALVYQDHSLFPHLNVRQNIGFGLRMRKQPNSAITKKVQDIATLMKVGHVLDRRVERLSGGEKQKVALARALILTPGILLLDEPLGALDQESKESLREELRRLHRQLQTTIIHVTHDFQEAISMADRMAVIGDGMLVQEGTAEQIFRKPESIFVARFTLSKNILSGEVQGTGKFMVFSTGNFKIGTDSLLSGSCHGVIRPEDINLAVVPSNAPGTDSIPGTIKEITDWGASFVIEVDVPPIITCMIPRSVYKEQGFQKGQAVYMIIKRSSLWLIKQ